MTSKSLTVSLHGDNNVTTTSPSEVTTLWRYTNLFIIIIITDIGEISGVARNVNWGGAPLPCPLPLPLLTGIRGYNPGNFFKLKVLVGEF